MKVNMYNTDIILKAFQESDRFVIQRLYKDNYFPVEKMVIDNSGSKDEAREIFQEALVIILHKVRNNDLHLDCSFQTYLFAICKNLWLKELWRKRKMWMGVDPENLAIHEPDELHEQYVQNLKYRLFYKHFRKLSEICQKVIRFYLDKMNARKIASMMNYQDKANVRRKKYNCKMALIRNIRNDPEYKDIEAYENKDELRPVDHPVSQW
jgi:RNA polymerase sigma factor (sigma-70 family)